MAILNNNDNFIVDKPNHAVCCNATLHTYSVVKTF